MLPFDNKSEFQVVVDMPEGSTLEQTAAATREIGDVIAAVPEVLNYQMYVGTSSPYNFNGLVRHYFLRRGANVADLQVNLVPKGERKAQSHDIAKRVRPAIQAVAARYGANVKVRRSPRGRRSSQTLVAEVYGPDYHGADRGGAEGQGDPSRRPKGWWTSTGTWRTTSPGTASRSIRTKAALNGVSTEQVAATLRLAVDGTSAGLLHRAGEKEDVPIVLRLPLAERSKLDSLKAVRVMGRPGEPRAPRASWCGSSRRRSRRRASTTRT